ncbi:MAG: hypothetical protein EP298_04355 [Gammaproteobacteria bacterium]|nr:MAG: hypothetical protein EP298_04355 [Gammaproteobacteria bacterium]UTW41644.1 hypothetical protein KFE69_09005 [bacterium SCSIO 12844]
MNTKNLKSRIILILSIFNFPLFVYANSEYNMYITNNTDVTIQISATNVKCMEQIEDEGGTHNIETYFQVNIAPGNTYNLYLKDEDTGSCSGNSKRFDLVSRALLSSEGIEPLDGVDYKTYLRWIHDKNDGNWETMMTTFTDDSYSSNVLTYTNVLCQSGSDWIGCSSWIDGGSNFKATVEETNYEYQIDTLNLGNAVVTDGFGKIIPIEPLTNSIEFREGITYYVRFSKISTYCMIKDELITCPSSIDFISYDKDVVFACAQTELGDSTCPWTIEA